MRIFYNESDDATKNRLSKGKGMWPTRGQRLLIEPSNSTPKELSVNLDWLTYFNPTDKRMSSAYKDGADLMIEALRYGGTGMHPDPFIFPVLYLYRHAIELEMKNLISMGLRKGLISSSRTLETAISGHNLYKMWTHAKKVLISMWPDGDRSVLSATESLVQQLHRVDPDGQQVRYTTTLDGDEIEHALPDHIDLGHLRAVMDALWSILSINYSAPEYDTD